MSRKCQPFPVRIHGRRFGKRHTVYAGVRRCFLNCMPDRLFVALKRKHLIDEGGKCIGLGDAGRKKRAAKHRQVTRRMKHEDPHDLGNRLDTMISSLSGWQAHMDED